MEEKEKIDCEHENKAYARSGRTLTCYPPINISYWICKDCGFEGEDRSQETMNTEYEDTKAKFNK